MVENSIKSVIEGEGMRWCKTNSVWYRLAI